MAAEILAYLDRYHNAQDTLDGIVEWWLLEQDLRRRYREVRTALDELIGVGLVTRTTGGGEVRYKINTARQSEVRQIVDRWEEVEQ